MQKVRSLSVLLAAALLALCVAGVLFTGAGAAEAPVLKVTGTAGADSFASIEAALAKAETMAKSGDLGDEGVKILVSANQTATVDENGILFGQKTIWLDMAQGKKLPITIEGSSTSVSIAVTSGNVACANDYTFVGLEFAIGAQATVFYAGSGNVVFERVTFGGTSAKFFADNFTSAAYEGWPTDYSAMTDEKGLVVSSLTFGENSEYFIDSDNILGAVGYTGSGNPLSSITAKIADDKIEQAKEDAKDVTFAAATGLEDLPDIKPIDTKAVLIIDTKPTASEISSKDNCIGKPTVRYGLSPVAEAELAVYSGVVKILRADRCNSAWETFVGDTYLSIYGGTFTNNDHFVRGLNACNLIGSFHIYVTQLDENVKTEPVGTTGGLQQTYNTPRVTESCTLTVDGGSLKDVYGGTADKKVTNVIKGGTFSRFFGARFLDGGTTEVENIITGGTFSGAYYGLSASKNWPVNLKSITNKISGGTFADVIYTASSSQAYTTLKNGVSTYYLANQPELDDKDGVGPVFEGCVYGAYVKDAGKILNVVEAATFNGKDSSGIGVFLSAHTEHNGGIENVINGGTFKNYVYVGGQTYSSKVTNTKGSLDLDGNLLPSVKTTINGGTFHGFWGANGSVSGSVVTTVNGGDFYPYQENFANSSYANAFAGGTRTADNTAMPDITNYIYGGTFHSNFYAGSGLHNKATERKVFDGAEVKTYLYGGTFKLGIFANSKHPEVGPLAESAEMIVDPSKSDTPLTVLGGLGVSDGDTSHITIVGGDEAILIGSDSSLVADTLEGDVKICQTEGWYAHDYFRAPANSAVTVTEESGVFGKYTSDPAVLLVKGYGMQAKAATLLFDTKVGVKLLFDPADVALFGDDLSFKVKLDGSTLYTVAAADLADKTVDGTAYKSYIVGGIGLKDFGTEITLEEGALETQTISIYSLAQTAQTVWSGEWLELANAIVNLHEVYNLDQDATEAPESASYADPSVSRGAQVSKVESPVATLLMGDAVGVRVAFTLTEAPVNFKATIGGQEIPADLITVGAADAETGKVAVSMDLFFNPKYMEETFDLVLSDDGGDYFTYTASVAAMASQLAGNTQNENADNAAALLYYIQQAVDCANL